MRETTATHEPEVSCVWCANDLEFTLPAAVTRAATLGKLVIFAGAGVSTESSTVYPTSLYDDLRAEIEVDRTAKLNFPEVMSRFEALYGRRALITEISERLDYVKSFPRLHQMATRFHRELATITGIQTIITTNWDTAFEDHCGARPFVVDEDYAYWELRGRRVFKIHGSVTNVSTIIATEEDYEARERLFATSAMGSTLKHILATDTVVFVGFSLTDPDFQAIYRALMKGLGRSRPPAYLVTPFENQLAEELGLRVLTTDGTHFLRHLKQRLVENDVLFHDTVLERARVLAKAAADAQDRIWELGWKRHPGLAATTSYLDGVLDLTGRCDALWRTGEYSLKDHLAHTARGYEHYLKVAVSRRRWLDAAYIHGYLNAIVSFYLDDSAFDTFDLVESFDDPEFFDRDVPTDEPQGDEEHGQGGLLNGECAGFDPASFPNLFAPLDLDQITARYAASPFKEKSSFESAIEDMKNAYPDDMIFRHTPFLDGIIDADSGGHPRL